MYAKAVEEALANGMLPVVKPDMDSRQIDVLKKRLIEDAAD
jgi:hypothetical protein